jgi:hypothetical protein
MVCPIGLPGITSKLPAAIAASVCAQLLMVWEAQQIAALNDSEPALAPRIALIFEFSFKKDRHEIQPASLPWQLAALSRRSGLQRPVARLA